MRILVTAPYDEAALAELRALGPVRYAPWTELGRPRDGAELAALVREAGAEAVIVELDQVGAEVLDVPGVRVVGCCRAGLVNVDLAGARERGVTVLRAPGRNAQAVAEWVVAAVLGLLRNTGPAGRFLRAGEWRADAGPEARPYLRFRGHELSGRTVALVGLGAVPRRLAPILHAFGARLLGVDPVVDASGYAVPVEPVAAEDAARRADVLSVHLPVTDATRGLVGRRLLDLLRPHAIVVNSARAAVFDTAYALDLLEAGRLGGVALDVYPDEPPSEDLRARLDHPGVFATPHIGGATYEVERHHARIMNAAFTAWLAGSPRPETIAA